MTSSGPMQGTGVLDLTDASLAHVGRLLVDLGADVVLVEPPGGGPARLDTARFAALAAGKRSLTLDTTARDGADLFDRLAARADVALLTPGDADPAHALHRAHPQLVITAVTPYGLRGPRRRWTGSDLTAWASGGVLPSVGDPDRAPLSPAGGLALFTAATNAAMATALALRARRRTGRGQIVDISLQEAVMSVALEAGPYAVMETPAAPQERTGMRRSTPPIGQYRTSDGAVSIVAYMPWQWEALARWIAEETGNDEVLLDAFAGTPAGRSPFVELIDTWVEDLTGRYTKQAFFEEAQRRGIPASPVNSVADLADDPHLAATDAWQFVDDPRLGPLRYPRPPIRFDGDAGTVGAVPEVGEHTDEILRELGVAGDQIEALRSTGAV